MELIIRESARSRSPSLGAVSLTTPTGRTNRRKITVIDGNFQTSQNDLRGRSQTPPPSGNTSVVSPRHAGDTQARLRAMTSPPGEFNRSSRGSSGSYSMTQLDALGSRCKSPALSWRSSTSSLADTAVTSLIQPPSSEQKILRDIRNQMMESFKHARQMEREANQIPKLRNDLQALYKEREKLMNELLEQKAVVMQLKQRVTLLHEQNQELARLAQSDVSANSQVLAIRNTLVATLAQLKQMEDQVQTIPGLKSQIWKLEEERKHANLNSLKVAIPSDLPEGVSESQYANLFEENVKLKVANSQLMEEMKLVTRHLSAVSESCEGLKSRMELFYSSQNTEASLLEKIKRLEEEKASLYQDLVDVKYRHDNSGGGAVDLDLAHFKKEARSFKKANSRLRSKIEHMKTESRQQKEQLVLKLFEIESLNIKTSRYEIEKQLLEMEQVHIQSEGDILSSSPPAAAASTGDDPLRDIPPDGRALMLRFQQLEVHSFEMQNVIKTFVSERQEMEAKIAEMTARLSQTGIDELQRQLEESDSKLVLARERIHSLEETLTRRSVSPEQETIENERDAYRQQVNEMKQELRRLSVIERQSVFKGSQTDELAETREELHKVKGEREKLNRKVKEGRVRLKSIAGELANSAKLVNQYQQQCSQMGEELASTRKEMDAMREELARTKATLEVSQMECALQEEQTDSSAVSEELQTKIDNLSSELSLLSRQKAEEIENRERKIQQLEEELGNVKSHDEASQSAIKQTETKLRQLELSLEQANQYKVEYERVSKTLSEKNKSSNEIEFQLNELRSAHSSLGEERRKLSKQVQELTEKSTKLTSENESLQQKAELLSRETPTLIQQSTELKVARDKADRQVQSLQSDLVTATSRIKELEEKLQAGEMLSKDLKKKLRLLQSDLDEAESSVDAMKENEQKLKAECRQAKEERETSARTVSEKEGRLKELLTQSKRDSEKLKEIEDKLKSTLEQNEKEKSKRESLETQLAEVRSVEIPKLHSELAKTVAEMGQLTTDYSSRVAKIRELESNYQQSESERLTLARRVESVERENTAANEKVTSLKAELGTKTDELRNLQSTHTLSVTQNQKMSDEARKLRDELRRSQDNFSKRKVEISSLKADLSGFKEKAKTNQLHITKLESQLQQREHELHNLRAKAQEMESLKARYAEREAQCEMLTATRDNLLHRLDRMEKLEMDYEMLKQRVHEVLGQSSQLKNDNKALLQLLEGVEMEMPALEKEVTRNLQEENVELQQQVSLLSQWNDKHQQTITTMEQQIEAMMDERKRLQIELMQANSLEQSNRQLKKEIAEVEIEMNRLKRQGHSELQEEMKVKLETQAQLLSIFNEHNKALQVQVTELLKQVKMLGGHLVREKPASPPPMPELSSNTQYISFDARRCSELEVQNASLQQQIGQLQVELIAAQEISPSIRRRSSTLLAKSSVSLTVPSNENNFVSVPEEMLLPCSVLADAFISKREIPEEQMQSYLRSIAQGWFTAVAQKSISSDSLKCYITTFGRLSSHLLEIIVNMQDARGNSALHHTLANGNFPTVSVLLDLKICNTNITNKAGYTPLMLTAAHNIQIGDHKSVLQKLLARTDVNIRSKVELQTALMLAVSSGSLELVSMLLESGSDINAQDKDGSTSLMFACEKGYSQIAQKLLSNPTCNAALKDNDGQTALDIALSTGHKDLSTLLKNYKIKQQAMKKR